MRIKTLSRTVSATDETKLPRNLDPALHPFERAREYTRALNATKLNRLFAAPFIAQLGNGHVDGVYSISKDPNSLQRFASGSGDGTIKVWDMTTRGQVWESVAHENIVKGISWTKDSKLLTCGADRAVKLFDPYNTQIEAPQISTWLTAAACTSISHHRSRESFAVSCSSSVNIYDLNRHDAAPEVLKWPNFYDTILDIAFNQVEQSVLASCSTDRSIILYDVRTNSALAKTVLNFASNRVVFSPMEAFNMAVANEDHNVYIFDIRKFDRALNILKDHVAAVMDVEFSPTGEELVTASYDRTIRIWNRDRGHSRDIYHTKRMQRVFRACFTPDSKFILSGSDDGNVRLWRAQASERQGIKSAKQRQALEYNNTLRARYAHMPEIRRITRHRHIPKVVKRAQQIKAEELAAIKRREENERKHSKKKFDRRKPEREKVILVREK